MGLSLGTISFIKDSRRMRCLAISLVFIGFGMVRSWYAQQDVLDPYLEAHIGETVRLSGLIVSDPETNDSGQKASVRLDDHEETVLVFAALYPKLSYGDRVKVEGVLKKPEPFETDSGRLFNYPAFLARTDIFHIVQHARVGVVSPERGNPIHALFIRAKHAFVASIERTSSEPYAGLAAGVVLGVENALSKDHEEAFRIAGLIHIIVVSGYNITMAGDFVRGMLGAFPSGVGLAGNIIGIFAYIALTGASSTAIRAGIMASVAVVGRVFKRKYDVTRALLLAACFMALQTPDILLYDPSFQLSFLATWGLTRITPFFESRFAFLTERFGIRETISTTLGAQTAVLPLILYQSGSTHLLSLFANFIVLPAMPALMITSLVAGVTGFFGRYLALPFSFLIDLIGVYVFGIVESVNKYPDAMLRVGVMPVWVLVGAYVVMVVWVLRHRTS
jgi:competence protein ComEC